MSSYNKQLKSLMLGENKVTINRADADDVTGVISVVDDEGCAIAFDYSGDTAHTIFIAHRDIRGVSSFDWDYAAIAK